MALRLLGDLKSELQSRAIMIAGSQIESLHSGCRVWAGRSLAAAAAQRLSAEFYGDRTGPQPVVRVRVARESDRRRSLAAVPVTSLRSRVPGS